jgi:hypothetical protein
MAAGDRVADAAERAGRLGAERPGVVAAAAARERELGRLAARLGEHGDHAARRVAVERRERAAQHLDALGREQREAAGLPLPVGHRLRDVVLVEPDPAHAERRARAEAARADLDVLRVVLAVVRDDARDAHERLGQVDHRLLLLDLAAPDRIDRRRHVEAALAAPRRRDHERVERRIGGRRRLRGGRGGGERGTGSEKAWTWVAHRALSSQGEGRPIEVR